MKNSDDDRPENIEPRNNNKNKQSYGKWRKKNSFEIIVNKQQNINKINRKVNDIEIEIKKLRLNLWCMWSKELYVN